MVKYEGKVPTPNEYNYIADSVGWGATENKIIEIALKNSIYSICAYDGDKMIGYGRMIGDKTMFLYIQDIMVLPEYQSQKVGTHIIEKILNKVKELKKKNPNIRTYVGPSKGKEGFYEKFGFISREEAELGKGMILKIWKSVYKFDFKE